MLIGLAQPFVKEIPCWAGSTASAEPTDRYETDSQRGNQPQASEALEFSLLPPCSFFYRKEAARSTSAAPSSERTEAAPRPAARAEPDGTLGPPIRLRSSKRR